MSPLLHFIFLIPLVLTAKLCEDKDTTVCGGCPKRFTFEQAWLEQTHPDVAKLWSNSTFSAPTMEYKDCTSINATCPSGNRMAAFSFSESVIIIDAQLYKNPSILRKLECKTGYWYNSGLSEPVNKDILSISLSCIKP